MNVARFFDECNVNEYQHIVVSTRDSSGISMLGGGTALSIARRFALYEILQLNVYGDIIRLIVRGE